MASHNILKGKPIDSKLEKLIQQCLKNTSKQFPWTLEHVKQVWLDLSLPLQLETETKEDFEKRICSYIAKNPSFMKALAKKFPKKKVAEEFETRKKELLKAKSLEKELKEAEKNKRKAEQEAKKLAKFQKQELILKKKYETETKKKKSVVEKVKKRPKPSQCNSGKNKNVPWPTIILREAYGKFHQLPEEKINELKRDFICAEMVDEQSKFWEFLLKHYNVNLYDKVRIRHSEIYGGKKETYQQALEDVKRNYRTWPITNFEYNNGTENLDLMPFETLTIENHVPLAKDQYKKLHQLDQEPNFLDVDFTRYFFNDYMFKQHFDLIRPYYALQRGFIVDNAKEYDLSLVLPTFEFPWSTWQLIQVAQPFDPLANDRLSCHKLFNLNLAYRQALSNTQPEIDLWADTLHWKYYTNFLLTTIQPTCFLPISDLKLLHWLVICLSGFNVSDIVMDTTKLSAQERIKIRMTVLQHWNQNPALRFYVKNSIPIKDMVIKGEGLIRPKSMTIDTSLTMFWFWQYVRLNKPQFILPESELIRMWCWYVILRSRNFAELAMQRTEKIKKGKKEYEVNIKRTSMLEYLKLLTGRIDGGNTESDSEKKSKMTSGVINAKTHSHFQLFDTRMGPLLIDTQKMVKSSNLDMDSYRAIAKQKTPFNYPNILKHATALLEQLTSIEESAIPFKLRIARGMIQKTSALIQTIYRTDLPHQRSIHGEGYIFDLHRFVLWQLALRDHIPLIKQTYLDHSNSKVTVIKQSYIKHGKLTDEERKTLSDTINQPFNPHQEAESLFWSSGPKNAFTNDLSHKMELELALKSDVILPVTTSMAKYQQWVAKQWPELMLPRSTPCPHHPKCGEDSKHFPGSELPPSLCDELKQTSQVVTQWLDSSKEDEDDSEEGKENFESFKTSRDLIPPNDIISQIKNNSGATNPKIKFIKPTKHQILIPEYFTPASPLNGQIVIDSVGLGKSCKGVRLAVEFSLAGFEIIWVTKQSLKGQILKNHVTESCNTLFQTIYEYLKAIKGQKDADQWLHTLPSQTSVIDVVRLLKQYDIHWTEMSYKVFSNALKCHNEDGRKWFMSNALMADKYKRSHIDPLRKKLIMIDEAHLMFTQELDYTEQPDVDIILRSFQKSYILSEMDRCRVVFFTATPTAGSVLPLLAMINMLHNENVYSMMATNNTNIIESVTKQVEVEIQEDKLVKRQKDREIQKRVREAKRKDRDQVKERNEKYIVKEACALFPSLEACIMVATKKKKQQRGDSEDEEDDEELENIKMRQYWSIADKLHDSSEAIKTTDLRNILTRFWKYSGGLISYLNASADYSHFPRTEIKPIIMPIATRSQQYDMARIMARQELEPKAMMRLIRNIAAWRKFIKSKNTDFSDARIKITYPKFQLYDQDILRRNQQESFFEPTVESLEERIRAYQDLIQIKEGETEDPNLIDEIKNLQIEKLNIELLLKSGNDDKGKPWTKKKTSEFETRVNAIDKEITDIQKKIKSFINRKELSLIQIQDKIRRDEQLLESAKRRNIRELSHPTLFSEVEENIKLEEDEVQRLRRTNPTENENDAKKIRLMDSDSEEEDLSDNEVESDLDLMQKQKEMKNRTLIAETILENSRRKFSSSQTAKITSPHYFDTAEFEPETFKADIPNFSPKLQKLLEKIYENDVSDTGVKNIDNESDLKYEKPIPAKYGPQLEKRFIFCEDIHAIRAVAGGLCSLGWKFGMQRVYKKRKVIYKDAETNEIVGKKEYNSELETWAPFEDPSSQDDYKRFLILTKSKLGGPAGGTHIIPDVLTQIGAGRDFKDAVWNHPDNIHGKKFRIIIIDRNFKQGVDLPAKYCDVFDPVLSRADMIQLRGRISRFCGSSGSKFIPNYGWPQVIYRYDLKFAYGSHLGLYLGAFREHIIRNMKYGRLNSIVPLETLKLAVAKLAAAKNVGAKNDPINKKKKNKRIRTEGEGEMEDESPFDIVAEQFVNSLEVAFSPTKIQDLLNGDLRVQELKKKALDAYNRMMELTSFALQLYKPAMANLERSRLDEDTLLADEEQWRMEYIEKIHEVINANKRQELQDQEGVLTRRRARLQKMLETQFEEGQNRMFSFVRAQVDDELDRAFSKSKANLNLYESSELKQKELADKIYQVTSTNAEFINVTSHTIFNIVKTSIKSYMEEVKTKQGQQDQEKLEKKLAKELAKQLEKNNDLVEKYASLKSKQSFKIYQARLFNLIQKQYDTLKMPGDAKMQDVVSALQLSLPEVSINELEAFVKKKQSLISKKKEDGSKPSKKKEKKDKSSKKKEKEEKTKKEEQKEDEKEIKPTITSLGNGLAKIIRKPRKEPVTNVGQAIMKRKRKALKNIETNTKARGDHLNDEFTNDEFIQKVNDYYPQFSIDEIRNAIVSKSIQAKVSDEEKTKSNDINSAEEQKPTKPKNATSAHSALKHTQKTNGKKYDKRLLKKHSKLQEELIQKTHELYPTFDLENIKSELEKMISEPPKKRKTKSSE